MGFSAVSHLPATDSTTRIWSIFFSLLLMCAYFFLFYALDIFPGLHIHEAHQATFGRQVHSLADLGRFFLEDTLHDTHHHAILVGLTRFLSTWFGDSLWAIRLPAVLFFLTMCVLLAFFSRKLEPKDPVTPWFHVLIFALHPMVLGWGRMGWEPSTTMFAVVWLWYPIFIPLEEKHPNSLRTFLLFAMSASFVLWAHPVHLFFIFSVACVALWERAHQWSDIRRRWTHRAIRTVVLVGVVIQTIVLLSYIGWYRYMLWTIRFVWHILETLTGTRILYLVTGVKWSLWHSVLFIATAIVAVLASMSLFRMRRRWFWRCWIALGLSILCFYLVLPWVHFFYGYGHQLLVLLGPFLFMLASGLSVMPKKMGRTLLFIFSCAMLLSFGQGYFVAGQTSENRGAHPMFWSYSEAKNTDPTQEAGRWIKTYIHTHSNARIYVRLPSMQKAFSFWTHQKVDFFWDADRGKYLYVPIDKNPWIWVDYYASNSPLTQWIGQLKKKNIPFQTHMIYSRTRRKQILIVYADPKQAKKPLLLKDRP